MLYLVLFDDAPEAPVDLRARHMAAHLAFLESTQAPGAPARVISAGPTTPVGSEAGSPGGLWIVDAVAVDAVWDLIRADPFWPTGLRQSVSVRAWRQVFAEGAVVPPQ